MAFSFPSSPTVNQTYTFNSSIWTFNGKGWIKDSAGGASVTASATAPASPTDGAMWLENESGDLYVYGGGNWILAGVASSPSFSGSYNDLTDKPTITSVVPSAVSDQSNTSTGYFDIPSGTTAQRPATGVTGATRINTTTNYLEMYYGGAWINVIYIGLVSLTYTGTPVITTVGNYNILKFNTSGSITCSNVPSGGVIEYLLVGGGGGGGNTMGGGGGAGGVLHSTIFSPTVSTQYSFVLGSGGAGATGRGANGVNGTATTAFGLTAAGGGGGASWTPITGSAGGSGGGGSSGNGAGGAATPAGQGYAGGTATGAGGGGGGAGGTPVGVSGVAGSGGIGLNWQSFGTYYAGGGGGGSGSGYSSNINAPGGAGGGGSGGLHSTNGNPGDPNTGSGGGGGGYGGGDWSGGLGGSGTVLIRYRFQ